jgi:hypothetical protein
MFLRIVQPLILNQAQVYLLDKINDSDKATMDQGTYN